MDLALVLDLAAINVIAQDRVEMTDAERQPTAGYFGFRCVKLGPKLQSVDLRLDLADGTQLHIEPKYCRDDLGFLLVDDQLAVLEVVTQGDIAAHPHAPLLGGRELVPDSLARDLPFKLGKGEKHIEGQPAHAGRGVEGLGYGHERDGVGVQGLDDLGKIEQRAGQPVDLVDHHHIHHSGIYVGQEGFQGRTIHGATGESAIVIGGGDKGPAFVALT